jgi:hypothetical protein
MKRCWSVISAVALATTMAGDAIAMQPPQEAAVEASNLDDLPVEVRAAIRQAVSVSDVLQIRGVERVSEQILAVDELIFQPTSTIEFTGEHPWVLLFAERVRVANPDSPLTIRRNGILERPDGTHGTAGSTGAAGHTSGAHGTAGARGGDGTPGQSGRARRVPDVYIVFGRIESTRSTDPLTSARMLIDFRGVAGGNGGVGGDGGAGGHGGGGRSGRRGDFGDCRRGPGNGGSGGPGGNGSAGGNGASGGTGGSVYLISTPQGADLLSAAEILTDGGAVGAGGRGGAAGAGGSGGSRGSRPGSCSGGSNGDNGVPGGAGEHGSNGAAAGERGRIRAVRINSVSALSSIGG